MLDDGKHFRSPAQPVELSVLRWTHPHVSGLVLGAGAAGEGPGVAVPRRHGVRVAPVSILRRRQGLQCAWGASVFSSKLLVQLLLCCNHFTGIALNP